MDDCERKYLGDQVRTLQMKCDLLSQQSEQHQQLIQQLKNSKKAREDIEGKCRVSICQVAVFLFDSIQLITFCYISVV